ncbi:hypothetical protein SAMN06272735_1833 [Streptomyces sp. TLI_55]|nr:hypothetical protein SAMN06272735_1833 [Streptomyces sp. TLI_55]
MIDSRRPMSAGRIPPHDSVNEFISANKPEPGMIKGIEGVGGTR